MLPIISPLIDIAGKVIDRLIPDKAEAARVRDEIENEIALAELKGQFAQIEINKVEAAHKSLFVAGWRPCIGWICALALGYQFLIAPVMLWTVEITGEAIPDPPTFDPVLWQLIFAMLGMGGLRSIEKLNGKAREK